MSLYKYIPPDRIDILVNGMIRFTQPSAFNDPFETFPCFTAGLPDEYIKNVVANNKIDKSAQEEMFRASFEAEMSKQGLKIPFDAVKDLPFIKAASDQIFSMTANLFAQFMSGSGDLFSGFTIKMALEVINKQFGVLCLTENPQNLLMWAHYADSHTGFLLEFDECHPFFERRTKAEEFGRCLQKVQYTKVRPRTMLFDPKIEHENYRASWAAAIFFSKSEHWAYEEEWRMVEYLKDSPRVIRSDPYNIYLFPLPMDCITGIVFGCRTPDATKAIIKHVVRTKSDCSHVNLSEATIDEREYELNIRAID